MRKKLMTAYLRGTALVRSAIRNFVAGEKGASDMIAVILLIVIIIAIAGIFRESLMRAAQGVMDQLSEFVGG